MDVDFASIEQTGLMLCDAADVCRRVGGLHPGTALAVRPRRQAAAADDAVRALIHAAHVLGDDSTSSAGAAVAWRLRRRRSALSALLPV